MIVSGMKKRCALYAVADDALEVKRKSWLGLFGASPYSLLHSAVRLLEAYLPFLSRLRDIAAETQASFKSEGWTRLLAMVREELDEGYLTTVRSYLKDLRFDGGVMVSAMLGPGNEIWNHMLRKLNARSAHRLRSVLSPKAPSYSFTLDPRDEYSTRALVELRDRGI
ncbi:MAG: DNA mismatch repair protein MutS, partial [Spirochaetales bacterium]|nr:DNA mismatch repair protein MutS [Spirochaetales bacterium]